MNNALIYGKDTTERIVSVEVGDNSAEIFRELPDGTVQSHVVPHKHWLLYTDKLSDRFQRLDGNLPYKWLVEYDSREKYESVVQGSYKKGYDFYTARDPKTNFMLRSGVTYFKGMKIDEVSRLNVDIETGGTSLNGDSLVALIGNTFRKNGKVIRKQFCIDEYPNQDEMIKAWCRWVIEINPSIIIGHNILGFDLPYLEHCGGPLILGRDRSAIAFDERTRQKRKDGSQAYKFKNVLIYGREIIDTFFLAINYPGNRDFPSFKLKEIIACLKDQFEEDKKKNKDQWTPYQESLLKRLKASCHAERNWDFDKYPLERILSEKGELWEKFKRYNLEDSDDSDLLFEIMAPAFFYYNQYIPMSFQEINNTATGSQLNYFLVRGYLQDGHSIPKADEAMDYEGAISFGVPGRYTGVAKVDIASQYPSIMREHKVYNKEKDPKGYFLIMIDTFTVKRLENKKKAKETGDLYYTNLEQSEKIVVNSGYGMLGAPRLNFNSPKHADFVTRTGREILSEGIKWASGREVKRVETVKRKKDGTTQIKITYKLGKKVTEGKGYQIVNADTDSFSYVAPTKDYVKSGQFKADLTELNALFPNMIRWEDDGVFKRALVVKTKNYVLDKGDRVVIKGSALKATSKEKALRRFIQDAIDLMLENKIDHIFHLYNRYADDCLSVTDISDWCFKKTITAKLLNSTRTNEAGPKRALEGVRVSEGDKVYMFFKAKGEYCLRENFDGTYDKPTLLRKLHKTVKVFSKLIDVSIIPDYSIKRNRPLIGLEDSNEAA